MNRKIVFFIFFSLFLPTPELPNPHPPYPRALRIGVMYSRDRVDHVQTHLDATVGVIGPVLGQTAHAIITVTQQFDAQTRVFLGQTVEPTQRSRVYYLNTVKYHTRVRSTHLANSSLSSLTSSWAVHWSDRLVKPQMSANKMLRERIL